VAERAALVQPFESRQLGADTRDIKSRVQYGGSKFVSQVTVSYHRQPGSQEPHNVHLLTVAEADLQRNGVADHGPRVDRKNDSACQQRGPGRCRYHGVGTCPRRRAPTLESGELALLRLFFLDWH
jgi:hypothetical protein